MAVESIEVANQINEAIAKQQKLLAKSTKELKDQLALMRGIASAHEDQDFDKALKTITETSRALEQVGESAHDSGRRVAETRKALEKLSEQRMGIRDLGGALKTDMGEQFPLIAGAATGFVSGLTSGLDLISKGASAAVGAISTLGGGIFGLAKSIISIPFKILGGLVDMANSLPSDTAFGEAREAIRKDFGDFSEDIALTTRTMFRSLRGELAETGLSVFRVFGNRAEKLRAMHEVIKGMGNVASLFGKELRDAFSAEHILAFQKGLGISNEQMKQIGLTAKSEGRTMQSVMLDITKASTGFADEFGLSQKVIAKQVAEMTADFAHFGSLTVHEMARAAVYVNKLGLEIKEVIGVIEAYDNFEDAALGAAHLAQAFGANVDALEMMREQDPTKRLDMLRKSMAMAGVDAANLSRQELKLLAQQTGLSEEAAAAAFSLRNQGISMAELEKQQKRNERSTMTQEEAMVRLSDSIERLIKSGSMSGGFLTQFLKGFERGIKRFSEFRRVLRFVRQDLRIFRWLGIQTGRAFVNLFPGVQKMIDGMLEFFNPRRFRQLKSDLSGVFQAMFTGSIDLEEGIGRITKTFVRFFKGPGGMKFLEGAWEFGGTIVKFIAQGLEIGMKFLAKAFDGLADFIQDPKAFLDRIRKQAASAKNPLVRMFKPLLEAFVKNWPRLSEAFMRLITVAWEKLKPKLAEFAKKAIPALFATMFAPAVIQAGIGAVAGSALKAVGLGIKRIMGFGVQEGAVAASRGLSKAGGALEMFGRRFSTEFVKSGSKFLRVAGPIGIAVGAALSVSEGLDLFYDKIDPKFDEVTRKFAAAGTGMVHGLTLGLLPEDLEVRIANAFASIADMVFDGLGDVFGAKFVENLKEYMSPVIDFWGALGDAIVGLITGDEAKFDAAFDEMFDALVSTVINGMKFMLFDAVPALITFAIDSVGMIGRALTRAVRMLWDKVGDITEKAVTAVFGETIGKGVGLVFDTIGNIYDSIATFVFETIPDVFSGIVDWFGGLANDVWDAVTGELSWSAVWAHFTGIADRVVEPFVDIGPKLTRIWEGFGDSFREVWQGVVDWFMGTIDDIKAGFDRLGNYVSDPSNFVDDAAAWGTGVADSISNGWDYVTGGAADNRLGTRMVSDVMDAASKQLDRDAPIVESKISKVASAWADKLSLFSVKFKEAWERVKTAQTFKDEARKMSTEGLSIEDMSLYQKVKDIDPKEVELNVRKFRDKVVPLFVGGTDSLMGQIRRLAKGITESDVEAIGKVSMVSDVAAKVATIGEAADKMAALATGIDPAMVGAGLFNTEVAIRTMMGGVGSIASSITDEGALELEAAQARIRTVADVIEGVVRQVNDINSELGDVETKPLKVKLKNLAKSLGVKNEQFKIVHDKVEIKIHLDVNMDAEHVAYAIQKGEWFTLSKGPKGPPHRSHA